MGTLLAGNILPVQANAAIGRAPAFPFPAFPVHPSLTRLDSAYEGSLYFSRPGGMMFKKAHIQGLMVDPIKEMPVLVLRDD
ncbi:MAG: hypothetical protein M0P73_17615, partial [Syntrophobacterales bacterium]|nr:hypothetical protein [Syntrophobacterales bacterium]